VKDSGSFSRREFVAAATATGLACATVAPPANPQELDVTDSAIVPPDAAQQAQERGIPDGYTADEAERYFVTSPGSDFMVDVVKGLDIDYLATNPGSSFRGLHESIVNYGGNRQPELLTCLHEEQAVALAHGYYKVAGKPIAVACHGTVGIQHAAMAVYNAWCDRVPVILVAGNHLEATHRRAGVEWAHSAQDCIEPIRSYIKWDDSPVSLPHFAESLVRAYKIALTPPMGPVAIVADASLQENERGDDPIPIPVFAPTQRPRGEDDAVVAAAALLVAAESPLIIADRMAHDQNGVDLLVDLAESLQAPVIDRGARMNFPNDHHLYQSGGVVAQADVILALEVNDVWGTINVLSDRVHREARRVAREDVRVITIGVGDLFLKSNYQNFQRYFGADLSIAGDAQATLPALIEAVKNATTRSRASTNANREQQWRARHAARREDLRNSARYAWDASPVSTARLSMELWEVIRDKDWALVSTPFFSWPNELWTMTRHYQQIGDSGGAGVGYGAAAAVGAALAHRRANRIAVNLQADGDLLYVPGILWTAAHHKIPLLSVMHNNRAYHQELMHLQRMASRRQRGVDGSAKIGTVLENPFVDFATIARGMGVWAVGPISDPSMVRPALLEALAIVERGEPAVVDVVCQPR
jgi:acetolactate synthase I/II/III large subunit